MDKEIISPKEFYTEMVRLRFTENPEMAHIHADEIMCEILRGLGYEAGVELFCGMEKWYS